MGEKPNRTFLTTLTAFPDSLKLLNGSVQLVTGSDVRPAARQSNKINIIININTNKDVTKCNVLLAFSRLLYFLIFNKISREVKIKSEVQSKATSGCHHISSKQQLTVFSVDT